MTTTTCPPHHWLIAPANGPTSKGRCQGCGETRIFKNTIEWDPAAAIRPTGRKRGPEPEVPKHKSAPYWFGGYKR